VSITVLLSCQPNNEYEPGIYLLKPCTNPGLEDGIFLKISTDSIEVARSGSIFLSNDYSLWLSAEINSKKTNIDSTTYTFNKSKESTGKSIFTITEPNREFDFEMIKVDLEGITGLNSIESLEGKRFSLLRDSSTKIHFLTDHHLVYKTDGTNPDFQRWYATPWINASSLILDGRYRNLLQIREDKGSISLYSPYQEKVVAVEDKTNFRRKTLIDSTKLAGTWTKVKPPIDKKNASLKIKPKTIKFEQGQLIQTKDTIYYFLDIATGFMDLQHNGSLVVVDLSADTMKLVGSDLSPYHFQVNNPDTIIYTKKPHNN
jgi:hypothetical protein